MYTSGGKTMNENKQKKLYNMQNLLLLLSVWELKCSKAKREKKIRKIPKIRPPLIYFLFPLTPLNFSSLKKISIFKRSPRLLTPYTQFQKYDAFEKLNNH